MQFLSVPQMEGARIPQGEKSKPSFIVSIRRGINTSQHPNNFGLKNLVGDGVGTRVANAITCANG